MPFKTNFLNSSALWTRDDWWNVALASVIPAGAGGLSAMTFLTDKDIYNWYLMSRKPTWAPTICSSMVIDAVGVAPLGYASYLVWKAGGFECMDTKIALIIYGAHCALMVAAIPSMKKKCHKAVFGSGLLIHLSALATAAAFFKVNKDAGMWMLPQVLATGFHTFLSKQIKDINVGPEL